MTFWLTLAGMVAATFGSRYAGLVRRTELPEFWVRFLHFVPIAVFASLVTPYLEGDLGEWGIRVATAAVAALAAGRNRQLWVAIAVGMAVFWLCGSRSEASWVMGGRLGRLCTKERCVEGAVEAGCLDDVLGERDPPRAGPHPGVLLMRLKP